jgi:hypothetical protein
MPLKGDCDEVKGSHCGSEKQDAEAAANHLLVLHMSAYVGIRQRTSAYVSVRQHTSAYVRARQHTSAYVSIRQHTSAQTPKKQDFSSLRPLTPVA